MTTIAWVAREGTKPETWNPFVGCSLVSPGCTNCYAMHVAGWIDGMGGSDRYSGTVKEVNGRKVWTGLVKRSAAKIFEAPLRWTKPRTVFANSMSDLFHESISDEDIDAAFAVMALTPQHTYQILTKRPERMHAYFAETWQPAPARTMEVGSETIHVAAETRPGDRWDQINHAIDALTNSSLFDQDRFWTADGALIGRPAWPRVPLPNVWLGISAEDQQRLEERWHYLRDTPAAIRFISAEPLLGPLHLALAGAIPRVHHHPDNRRALAADANRRALGELVRAARAKMGDDTVYADWVIVGGESGPRARPFDLAWARSIRDQCQTTGVAVFIKQMGAKPSDGFASLSLKDGKGEDASEWPEDLRVRDWPG